jgi:hypothetical protein
MARIDDLTREFMDKVAGVPQKEETPPEKHLSLKPFSIAKQVLKGVDNPQKAIGKILVRTALGEVMDKEGEVGILSLYSFLNDHYERAWWDWEPETIWAELARDHFSGGTPDEIKDAVMALQLVLNTNAPFEHWHIFEKVGHAFGYNPVDFTMLQPLEPDEAALAMALLSKIRPQQEFDQEVLMYVAVCAKSAGMVWLPEDLFPKVQPQLDEINFEVGLRDSVRKAFEEKSPSVTGAIDIQLARINEVRDYVKKGMKGA